MKGKLVFVLGAAVGYVLGTRAGRERYEQIKRGAQRVWNTEPVQHGVELVKDVVDEKTDDLKELAIRFGGELFSNLARARQSEEAFATTDEAAGGSGGAAEGGSKPAQKTAQKTGQKTKAKTQGKAQPKSRQTSQPGAKQSGRKASS